MYFLQSHLLIYLFYNLNSDMYQLQSKVAAQASLQATPEQLQKIREIDQYLQTNRVHQILNEGLAKLIQTKPQKIKPSLVSIFKSIKERQTYFKKSDFENMFQSYDFFTLKGINQISYSYLIQALEKINVVFSKQQFLDLYPQFKLDRMVKKMDFINIMEAQYKKKVKF